VNNELVKVLPPEARGWLRTAGASGVLDVDGHIKANANYTSPADAIGYDLDVTLRDGSMRPAHSDFTIADAAGKMTIHPDRMEVLDLHGKRGDATLAGSGSVDWSSGRPVVKMNVTASSLALDPALCQLLPAQARQAWTELDPHGAVNAELFYQGTCPAPPGEPIASLEVPSGVVLAIPQNTTEDFKLVLQPTDVSITAKALPYHLDYCNGKLTVTPRDITLEGFHGRHGDAAVDLSGKGITTKPQRLGSVASGARCAGQCRAA